MKTPEEIKKGLEIAVNGCMTCECCITDCPYDLECHPMNEDTNVDMPKQMAADALAYIQQLENQIGELTEKVEQLEAAQPKWISVKEKLPENDDNYLVFTSDRNDAVIATYYGDGEWLEYDLTNLIPLVTHWMSLPEPPEVRA